MSNDGGSLGRLQFASHARGAAVPVVWAPGAAGASAVPTTLTPLLGWALRGPPSRGFFVLPLCKFIDTGSAISAANVTMGTWQEQVPKPEFPWWVANSKRFSVSQPRCSCGLSSSPRFPFATKPTEDKKNNMQRCCSETEVQTPAMEV